jgi:hypothetical protein
MSNYDVNGFELSNRSATGYKGVGRYPNNRYRAYVTAPERFRHLLSADINNVLVLAASRNATRLAYYRQKFLEGVQRWGWEYMISEFYESGAYNWQPTKRFDPKNFVTA